MSPAHRQRTAPGAAFAVSWNVFGETARARRKFSRFHCYVVVQIFSPPLRPFSRFSPRVTKICFAPTLYCLNQGSHRQSAPDGAASASSGRRRNRAPRDEEAQPAPQTGCSPALSRLGDTESRARFISLGAHHQRLADVVAQRPHGIGAAQLFHKEVGLKVRDLLARGNALPNAAKGDCQQRGQGREEASRSSAMCVA